MAILDRKERRLAYVKRESLKRYALDFDVDPDGDFMKAGNSPPERAYQVARTAFDLLAAIAESGYPSLDRKVQKRAGKWMIQNLIFRGGGVAISALTHALPTLMVELDGRIADDDVPVVGAAAHESLQTIVRDFYPLEDVVRNRMKDLHGEYQVMRTHEPRKSVEAGEAPASPYVEALMRGENPDEDPALVEHQREWARDFFLSTVTFFVCRQVLALDFVKLQDETFRLSAPESPRRAQMIARLLPAWKTGSRTYREYAVIDSGR